MPVGYLCNVRFHWREQPQGLLEFKQRTDIMALVRHARRFFTNRVGGDLADVAEGDVLPALVNGVATKIRAEFVRSDKDGLAHQELASRVRPTWRGRGARGQVQGQELDTISRLLVRLAERALLERLADIFAPAGDEPRFGLGIVHDDDFAR